MPITITRKRTIESGSATVSAEGGASARIRFGVTVTTAGNRVTIKTEKGKIIGEFTPNWAHVFEDNETNAHPYKSVFPAEGATYSNWDRFKRDMSMRNRSVVTDDDAPAFIKEQIRAEKRASH